MRVSRREVFDNILKFQESVGNLHGAGKERSGAYAVLLNRKTGDIEFSWKIDPLRLHPKMRLSGEASEWREAQMKVEQQNGSVHFSLKDVAQNEFKGEGVEHLAFQVIRETLDALNRMALHTHIHAGALSPEREVLKDLSQLSLETSSLRIDDMPGWVGSMSRFDAEALLRKQASGTYLLRSADEGSSAIAFHLSEENRMDVRAFLCTVAQSTHKIVDILLLDTEKGWAVYRDNPDLNAVEYHYFTSLQALMHSLHSHVKRPIG